MRWDRKNPKYGNLKIVTKFLFLPKTIDGETRWLERATWERKYWRAGFNSYWINIRWID